MRKLMIVSLFVMLTSGRAGALNLHELNGSDLGLGVGSRAVSMGGAFSALADDASAMYWNPAGLTEVDHNEEMIMMDVDPVRYSYKAMVFHPEKWRRSKTNLALGFARTNRLKYIADGKWAEGNANHLIDLSMVNLKSDYVGGIDSRTNDSRFTIAGTLPNHPRLSLGMTYIKFECITTFYLEGSNLPCQIVAYDAFDFGMLYRDGKDRRYALSLRNPFEKTKPRYLNVGAAWFNGKNTYTADLERIFGEYSDELRKCSFLMFRAGWERDMGGGLKARAGLVIPIQAKTSTLGNIRSKLPSPKFGATAGLGYTFKRYTLDLAVFGDPGQSYVMSKKVINGSLTLSHRF